MIPEKDADILSLTQTKINLLNDIIRTQKELSQELRTQISMQQDTIRNLQTAMTSVSMAVLVPDKKEGGSRP